MQQTSINWECYRWNAPTFYFQCPWISIMQQKNKTNMAWKRKHGDWIRHLKAMLKY